MDCAIELNIRHAKERECTKAHTHIDAAINAEREEYALVKHITQVGVCLISEYCTQPHKTTGKETRPPDRVRQSKEMPERYIFEREMGRK